MDTNARILRLWEKMPELDVGLTYDGSKWMLGADSDRDCPFWYFGDDQQAHDLAAGPIERWILRAGYWTEIKSRRDSLQGLANVTIAYWVGGEKIICGGDTKIEALLSAAERVAGLETT